MLDFMKRVKHVNPMLNYKDIPKLTGDGRYQVDVDFLNLEKMLEFWNVDMDPDFQRGYVWTRAQQIAYVETRLRGEVASRMIQLNNPGINSAVNAPTVMVDGKQRVTAVRQFLNNEFPIFKNMYMAALPLPVTDIMARPGYYFRDIQNFPGMGYLNCSFRFCINNLKTKAEVLKWYLELNAGGTIHTEDELNHVKMLLKEEQKVTSS